MANTTLCSDTTEAIELFVPQNLYLKPIAKVNVCVQLPQLKTAGKTISNWEVMEKIKHMVRPEIFLTLKIFKSTREFIRLEGEIENKGRIHTIILKLDGKTIKLSGFSEVLRVRAAEAKVNFPSRHDWDSYFRDSKTMDEMKPGERPDTIHIKEIPTRWFSAKHSEKEGGSDLMPSEEVVRKVFKIFGEIRCIDIPMLDPYRKEISANMKKTNIQTFSYGQDLTFECFIQYQDYISFVKAMDSLRGMKMLYRGEDKALTAIIKVDFDKTKHLSEKNIRRRRIEREKLEALERERLERARREKEEEERKKEEEKRKKEDEEKEKERRRHEKVQRKEDRRKEREEKRRQLKLEKKRKEEEERMQYKIALEERRFLIAQRKLESLRLLTELFERVKALRMKKYIEQKEKELEQERLKELERQEREKEEEDRRKKEEEEKKKLDLQKQEEELRNKILRNFKAKEEQKQEIQREQLRKKISGTIKLKSAVIMTKAGSGAKKRKKGGKSDGEGKEDSETTYKKKAGMGIGKQKQMISAVRVKSVAGMKIKSNRLMPEPGAPWSSSDEDKKGVDNDVEEISSDEDTGEESDDKDDNSVLARVLKANKMRAWREDVKEEENPSRYQGDKGNSSSSGRMDNVKDRGRGGRKGRSNLEVDDADIKNERRERDYIRGRGRGGGKMRRGEHDRESGRGNNYNDWDEREQNLGQNQKGRDLVRRGSLSPPPRSSGRPMYNNDGYEGNENKERRNRRGGSFEERGISSRSREPDRERSRSRSIVSISSPESYRSDSHEANERRRSRERNRSREDRGNRSRSRSRDREHRRLRPSIPPDGVPPMMPGPGGVMIPMPPFPMMFPGPMDMPFRPPFPYRGGRGGRGRGIGPMRGRGMGMRGGAMMPYPVPPPMAMFGPRFGGEDFYSFNNHMKDMSGRYAQPLQVNIPYKGKRDRDESSSNRRHRKKKHKKRGRRSYSRSRSRSYDSRSSSVRSSRSRSKSRSRDRKRRRRSHSDDRSRSRSREQSRRSRSRSSESRSRSRHRSRSRDRSRSKGRHRSRSRDREDRNRSKEKSENESKDGKNRSRSKDRRSSSESKDKKSGRSKSRDRRSRSRDRSRGRKKDRKSCSKSRESDKSRSKTEQDEQGRDGGQVRQESKERKEDDGENRGSNRDQSRSRSKSKDRDQQRSGRNGDRSWNNERNRGGRGDESEEEEAVSARNKGGNRDEEGMTTEGNNNSATDMAEEELDAGELKRDDKESDIGAADDGEKGSN